jgi:hypothetical protein
MTLTEQMKADGWESMQFAPIGLLVELLYGFPAGDKAVEGVFRSGNFMGRDTLGWWSDFEPHPPRYGFDARNPGMWIDGWIKAWRPRRDARHIGLNHVHLLPKHPAYRPEQPQ